MSSIATLLDTYYSQELHTKKPSHISYKNDPIHICELINMLIPIVIMLMHYTIMHFENNVYFFIQRVLIYFNDCNMCSVHAVMKML